MQVSCGRIHTVMSYGAWWGFKNIQRRWQANLENQLSRKAWGIKCCVQKYYTSVSGSVSVSAKITFNKLVRLLREMVEAARPDSKQNINSSMSLVVPRWRSSWNKHGMTMAQAKAFLHQSTCFSLISWSSWILSLASEVFDGCLPVVTQIVITSQLLKFRGSGQSIRIKQTTFMSCIDKDLTMPSKAGVGRCWCFIKTALFFMMLFQVSVWTACPLPWRVSVLIQ